jgi:transcription-repair coupling factor (superfamily II helicase)
MTAPDQRCTLSGVCAPARGAVLASRMLRHPAPVWLVVVEELRAAEQLAEDIAFFYAAAGAPPQPDVRVFPESRADSRDLREAFTASSDRLIVLSKLKAIRREAAPAPDAGPLVVVTTPAALLQPVPTPAEFEDQEITLTRGQPQSFQGLQDQLRRFDYDCEAVCEAPGQYAVRGGLIDVYPVTAVRPYRLDFFGDLIEDIRAIDPVTQRSGDAAERVVISASPRLPRVPLSAGLAEYLPPQTHLVLVEPAVLEEASSLIGGANAPLAGPSGFAPILARCAAATGLADLDEASRCSTAPRPTRPGIPRVSPTTGGIPTMRSSPKSGCKPRTRRASSSSGRCSGGRTGAAPS